MSTGGNKAVPKIRFTEDELIDIQERWERLGDVAGSAGSVDKAHQVLDGEICTL